MGCRTGFYVIFKEDLNYTDIVNLMQEMFKFIAEYEGEIPGSEVLLNIKEENLIYPN